LNKNEFRYIKKSDTIEGYKWYHEMIDFFKQEIKVMLDMVREDAGKNTPRS
jgi:DNA-directed RNA polymerase